MQVSNAPWDLEEILDGIEFFPRAPRLQIFRMPWNFKDPKMEKEFMDAQGAHLSRVFRKLSRVVFAFLLISFVGELLAFWDLKLLTSSDLTQIVSNCLGIILLLAFSTPRLEAGEKTSMAVMPFLVIMTMTTSRYRTVFFTGDDIAPVLERVDSSEVYTDSTSMVTICLCIEAFFVVLPVRCKYGIFHLAIVPLIYSGFTLPLPNGEFEGGMKRRMTLTLRIALAGLIGFIGRIVMETQARVDFLTRWRLFHDLKQERVLRVTAEHELEQGPFSSTPRPGHSNTKANRQTPSELQSENMSSLIFHPGIGPDGQNFQAQAIQMIGSLENWIITADQLQVYPSEELGKGGFGSVVRGRYLHMDVAVKVNRFPELNVGSLASELRILRKVTHPRIVRFFGACVVQDKDVFLVVELIEGPSLSHAIDFLQQQSPIVRHRVMLDICEALIYLHGTIASPIVHGDLKPQNICLEGPAHRAKIIDFGLAETRLVQGKRARGGTVRWAPPEILLKVEGGLCCGSDVFSFGRVGFFVITGKKPMKSLTDESGAEECVRLAKAGVVPELDWTVYAPETTPEQLAAYKALFESCMAFDADSRPTSDELLQKLAPMFPRQDLATIPPTLEDCEQSLLDALDQIQSGSATAAVTL